MSETYWRGIVQEGMTLPEDRQLDDLTVELVAMLADPDPAQREDVAWPILAAWIDRGVYDELLAGLGDGLAEGLAYGLGGRDDTSVLRRSASALLLSEVVRRDHAIAVLPASRVLAWGDLATTSLLRERDLRGWAPEIGWINAIAHGADLLTALAESRHLGWLELTVLLDVIADRLLAPVPDAWRHGEDDRFAHTVMTILRRGVVPPSVVEPWIARLGAGLRPAPTRGRSRNEWPSPAAANTSAFLRALHLQLVLAPEPPDFRGDLILAVLDQIRADNPWLRPTR